MDYKLFDEFITLQALLKELGIIQSGGAAKGFLAENTVLFNGDVESRRGKKIRLGDTVTLPDKALQITITDPSESEKKQHLEEKNEKERVAAVVKKLNKESKAKKLQDAPKKGQKKSQANSYQKVSKPVRFPGT